MSSYFELGDISIMILEQMYWGGEVVAMVVRRPKTDANVLGLWKRVEGVFMYYSFQAFLTPQESQDLKDLNSQFQRFLFSQNGLESIPSQSF